jgi:hypothetical protein
VSLDDVVAALGEAWTLERRPSRPPVLAELPPVGET